MSKESKDPSPQNEYPELSDVGPLDESDMECMKEIREVLDKYNKLERFGVSLLHKHFDLKPDEELVEVTDVEKRHMTISPMKKGEIPANELRGTSWYLGHVSAVPSTKCRSLWHA